MNPFTSLYRALRATVTKMLAVGAGLPDGGRNGA